MRVGWKIGLNVPEVQQKLGLERSVVGNLTSATLLRPGASHSLAGTENPKVEPEIAIEVGADGSIAGLAAAIEVVDFDRPVDDAYEIVSTNIFHRAVAIASSEHDVSPEGLTAALSLDGEERESAPADKFDLPAIVALVDETLAAADESLEVGDRIIAGSLTTPVDVAARPARVAGPRPARVRFESTSPTEHRRTMTTTALPDALSDAARSFAAGPHELLIGGERAAAADGRTFATIDPSTGQEIAQVAHGGAEDVDRAVRAAREALEGDWTHRTVPAKRAAMLFELARLVDEHSGELAELEALDNGKPVKLAKAVDVRLAAEHLRYFAGWPTKIVGQTIPVSTPGMHVYTRREPVGVCGQIIPWNFPLLMACWKIAPALAAGCTTVLKPAEQTPLTALRLGELALEAGIPAGRAQRGHRRRRDGQGARGAPRAWTSWRSPAPPRWGARSAPRPGGRSSA